MIGNYGYIQQGVVLRSHGKCWMVNVRKSRLITLRIAVVLILNLVLVGTMSAITVPALTATDAASSMSGSTAEASDVPVVPVVVVAGRLVAEDTRGGLGGVTACLIPVDDEGNQDYSGIQKAITDGSGAYAIWITGEPADAYQLYFDTRAVYVDEDEEDPALFYVSDYYKEQASPDRAHLIELKDGEKVWYLEDMALALGGVVSGRVTALGFETGLEDVEVSAYPAYPDEHPDAGLYDSSRETV